MKVFFICSLALAVAAKTTEQEEYAKLMVHDRIHASLGRLRLSSRTFVGNNMEKKWGAEVPYVINGETMNDEQFKIVNQAIEELNNLVSSCIKLVPRNNEDDYVEFENKASGCWADLGRTGGRQIVNLMDGCYTVDTVQHEILHAYGFDHTHVRSDRDEWLVIDWSNIKPGYLDELKELSDGDNFGLPYDEKSIMQYGSFQYCIQGEDCITFNGKNIGRNEVISAGDVAMTKKAFCNAAGNANDGEGKPNTSGGQSKPPACEDNPKFAQECPDKCNEIEEIKSEIDAQYEEYYSMMEDGEYDYEFFDQLDALITKEVSLTEFTAKNCKKSCKQCESDM